jgi:hypothetical protein
MPFDNVKFTAWLQEFEKYLIESGMPQPQAMKYRGEFYSDAVAHFAAGRTPGDAAMMELLGI